MASSGYNQANEGLIDSDEDEIKIDTINVNQKPVEVVTITDSDSDEDKTNRYQHGTIDQIFDSDEDEWTTDSNDGEDTVEFTMPCDSTEDRDKSGNKKKEPVKHVNFIDFNKQIGNNAEKQTETDRNSNSNVQRGDVQDKQRPCCSKALKPLIRSTVDQHQQSAKNSNQHLSSNNGKRNASNINTLQQSPTASSSSNNQVEEVAKGINKSSPESVESILGQKRKHFPNFLIICKTCKRIFSDREEMAQHVCLVYKEDDEEGHLCPTCNTDEDGEWVLCDYCKCWFHFKCQNITTRPKPEEIWKCSICVTETVFGKGYVTSSPNFTKGYKKRCGICSGISNPQNMIGCCYCVGRFHLSCIGLNQRPSGAWSCTNCDQIDSEICANGNTIILRNANIQAPVPAASHSSESEKFDSSSSESDGGNVVVVKKKLASSSQSGVTSRSLRKQKFIPFKFACVTCGKNFVRKGNLENHYARCHKD